MIHAVLLDLGGTLIDTADPLGWSATARGVGIEVDPDHLAHAYREVQAEFDRTGRIEDPSFWAAVLTKASGSEVTAARAKEFQDRWFALGEHRPPLFSDVRFCLEALQSEGLALGLVSNSRSEADCRAHLTRLGIQRFLPVVVSSGTERIAKPDPEIFRRGVERVGVRPSETVYVGDLPYTDAKGAEAAGLVGLWLNRHGWGFGDDPPEITTLTEVPNWIRLHDRGGLEHRHGPP